VSSTLAGFMSRCTRWHASKPGSFRGQNWIARLMVRGCQAALRDHSSQVAILGILHEDVGLFQHP